MKFLVIGPAYPFRGGIAHHTTLLVKRLAQEHEVLFISFKAQYPRWLFPGKTDRDPSREPFKVPCEYLLDPLNPFTWLAVSRRGIDYRPDIVFFPWWVPFWAICWWWLSRRFHRNIKAKIIFYCHNVQPHETMAGIRWLSRKALSQGDAFVVQSKPDRILLEGILRPMVRPIKTVNPPSLRALSEKPIDVPAARRALGLAEDDPVVMFFGFVRPYKGLDVLIQAFSRLLETTRARLLIAGEFWADKKKFLSLVDALRLKDSVTIVDRYILNEEVGLFFAAADVVVLPYRSSTGSAIAQLALSFHRPVIATKVGGLPEVVQEGKNGLLVNPENPEELAMALARFFRNNLKEKMTTYLKGAQGDSSEDWTKLIRVLSEIALDPDGTDK